MKKEYRSDTDIPKTALRLLTAFSSHLDRESLRDQLEEEYSAQLEMGGRKAARCWLRKQLSGAFPRLLTYLIYRRTTLWLNYIKITLRNFRKHKAFSIINLTGLTIGLTLCFLVIKMVVGMYSQDDFHKHKNRIYRVITEEKQRNRQFTLATSPLPLADELRQAPEVEAVVRIKSNFGGPAVYRDKVIPLSGYYVDPNFLLVFSFEMKSGHSSSALAEPNSMVLKESAALKIFGNQNPIGEILTVKDVGDYRITGIIKNLPHMQSHFDFECLVSTAGLFSLARNGIGSDSQSWENVNGYYLYFLLKKNMSPGRIQTLFPGIVKKYFHHPDKEISFRLQALSKISPGPLLVNPLSHNTTTPDEPLMMSLLAFIIMLIACFNYTNLSLAKSLSRAREVGIRKTIGAGRPLVFFQFIGEAVVFSLLALVAAVFLLELFIPLFFNEVSLYFDLGRQAVKIGLAFFVFTVLTGALAGLFPALYLSRFDPVLVLKDISRVRVFSRLTLRKILLVIQLCVSFIFIISTIVIYRQFRYQAKLDYGFNAKNIVNIELQETSFETLEQELASIAGVERIGACMLLPNTFARMSYKAKAASAPEFIDTTVMPVDRDFVEMIELEFAAGHNFPEMPVSAEESMVIINETAATRFGFESPESALGQRIIDEEKNDLEVIGVVKDFASIHVSLPMEPVLLRAAPRYYRYASVEIRPANREQTLLAAEASWQKLDPFRPFKYHYYDEQMKITLQVTKEVLRGVGVMAFLSGLIAFFGLLGMVIYDTESRIKEIGIRKVMGASTGEVIFAISRNFIGLLLLAAGIAAPIAWYINSFALLQNVSDRASGGIVSSLIGILAVCLLGLAVILSQTTRMANRNPVESLRYE